MYKDLFINRWKEMKQYLLLEREDGETTFLEKEVFHNFLYHLNCWLAFISGEQAIQEMTNTISAKPMIYLWKNTMDGVRTARK